MRALELVLGLVTIAIVLFYLFKPTSPQVINAIGTNSTGFVKALMGS